MSYRRTLVFLIIFAALATFFYFYEFKGAETRREAEQKAKLIFSFEPEDVTMLALRKPEQLIVAQRENDKWTITEPVNSPAEQATVTLMLQTLAELSYERDIGTQPDLEPFGLSEPEAEIEITGARGDIGRLLLGAFTPDGANFYVKGSANQQVFTVEKSAKDKIDRSLFDLRDKTVFDFSVPDVKALTITSDAQTFKFESRPDGEWAMTSPEEHSADARKVTALLDSIKYGRIKKFVEEAASDMKKYGLENPSARLELVVGDEMNVLSLGERTEPDSQSVYARRGDHRQVAELDAEIVNKLPADTNDWRDKRLVKFEPSKVTKLEIDAAEGRIAAERSAEDFEEWRLIEPEPALADEERIGSLLSELLNARVSRFLRAEELTAAEPAFEKPLIRLNLWEKDIDSSTTLLLSRTDEKPEVYARTGEGGEIFEVGEQLLNKLTISPDEMRSKSVLRFKPVDVEKIEVVREEKSFDIKRKDVQWEAPASLQMEPYEIDQFLWDLRELNYTASGPREEADEFYGFDSPVLTVKLWGVEADSSMRLLIGKRIPEINLYYALGSNDEQVLKLEGTIISDWLDKF